MMKLDFERAVPESRTRKSRQIRPSNFRQGGSSYATSTSTSPTVGESEPTGDEEILQP